MLRRFLMEQDAERPRRRRAGVVRPLRGPRPHGQRQLRAVQAARTIDKVPAAFNEPTGLYVAQRVSIISIYGRTDLVPPDQMPKTWTDLADPKFKGKLVMTNPNFTSLQVAVVAMLSRAHGWDFFERLNKNDVMIVQGNEQALNLAKTGERPIVAGGDSQYASGARLQGHKIDNTFPADGTFAVPSTTSVVKGSRNPNAAKLMAEFTLSLEAQKLWPKAASTPRAPTSIRRSAARRSTRSRCRQSTTST